MENLRCIYCVESDPIKFSGREHVIPQAFGKFGSKTPTLKCVCDGCNAMFGRELDQTLARETLEGLLRYNQGKRSSEKRPQRRLTITLADEREAGGFLGAVLEGIDATQGKVMNLFTQLQIRNLNTGKMDVFKRNQINNISLPTSVYGEPGSRKLVVYAPSKEEHDKFVEELNLAGCELRMNGALVDSVNPTMSADGTETLGIHIEGTFDQLHRRALAKIFVNFAAFYLGTSVVNSPDWEPLKRFVRFDEGQLAARISDKPFWSGQETRTFRFRDAINVRLENQEKGIVGVIQFYNRITYELLLVVGRSLSKEIGVRFEDGMEPTRGIRLSVANR